MTSYITLGKGALDLTGQRFGRLVALSPAERRRGLIYWLCRCDCGQTTTVLTASLRAGVTISCGCFRKEKGAQALMTHGRTKTRLYGVWRGMVGRCHRVTDPAYPHYGGRGIALYPQWRNSFEEFEFYVAQLPHVDEEGYTLDRINNNGNYEPGNVRWATQSEQSRNKRTNHLVTFDGKTQCITEWAKELGMRKNTLQRRLSVGWSVEDALSTPVRPKECHGKGTV